MARPVGQERSHRVTSTSPLAAAAHATEILRTQFRTTWTLDALARRVNSNRTDLERGVRTLTGRTVHDYLTQSRVVAAQHLLRTTIWSCEAVSREVGYRSKTSFYANFRLVLGMTPDEYRRRWTFVPANPAVAELLVSHWSCRY